MQKLEDRTGSWIDVHEAQRVVDAAMDEIAELRDLLRDIKNSHGVMLMSCPSQDSWINNRIDERISATRNANAAPSTLEQPRSTFVLHTQSSLSLQSQPLQQQGPASGIRHKISKPFTGNGYSVLKQLKRNIPLEQAHLKAQRFVVSKDFKYGTTFISPTLQRKTIVAFGNA